MAKGDFRDLNKEDLEKLARETQQDTAARQAEADRQAAEAKAALEEKNK